MKMKKSNANSLLHYSPGDAQAIVPSLEICWGSIPVKRPDNNHMFGFCQCKSKKIVFEDNGLQKNPSPEDQKIVLEMFSRHFNAHPLIPDRNGILRTASTIHSECATEMYTWCYAKGFFKLWAYLFANWYDFGQWKLWARSHHSEQIPVLKTTMIVESHWRKVKHDYLHNFARPRIDMVIWIFISQLIPQGISRMKAIQTGNMRKAVASWRKHFKQDWKKCKSQNTDAQELLNYHTDPAKWTCACNAFLMSRFLICKHIIYCFEDFQDPVKFF
ncbi:hypothetical protein K3495_g16125, partial [Podosphaera aphanis]